MPDWKKVGETKIGGLEVALLVCGLVVVGIIIGAASQDRKEPQIVKQATPSPVKAEVVASPQANPVVQSDFERGKALYEGWKLDHEGDKVETGLGLLQKASKSGKQKGEAAKLFKQWKLEAQKFQKELEREIRENDERERAESYSFTSGNPVQIAVPNAKWIQRSDGWVVLVEVIVQNVGLDPVSISAQNFGLGGSVYDWKETARTDEPFLPQEPDQKQVARGWVAFKVPMKSKMELKVIGIDDCFTDSKYVFESYP